MPEVKIIRFDPRHVEIMALRETEKFGPFQLKDAYERIERAVGDSVQSGTFLYDGRILFASGFKVLWPGVLEVWVISTIYMAQFPLVSCRILKRYLDGITVDFKAHRVQCTSYDDPLHARFMEFFGFKKEGVMRKFCHDKKDMVMYARVV